MSLKCAARKIFFITKILGTLATLGDSHSFNFAATIVNNGSNYRATNGSIVSDIGSLFPEVFVGALHPHVVSGLQPLITSIASNIASVFGAHVGCARPV